MRELMDGVDWSLPYRAGWLIGCGVKFGVAILMLCAAVSIMPIRLISWVMLWAKKRKRVRDGS